MKRVNVVLGDQEIRALTKLARERHQSKSATVRELIRSVSREPDMETRMAAWRELTSLNAPVADVETMKRETMEGFLGIRESDHPNP